MASQTYMQLIRGNRSFRLLLAGQVVSELGNWFNFVAGLGLVRAVSGGDPQVTAWVLMLRLAPFALFAPLAGVCVDRWSRRTVMLVTDVARAIAACGFLLVRGPEDLWLAYVSTFATTLLTAFFEAAKNAAVPNIVGERGLLAGNALMFSSRFLLLSLGAALGGWASARFGYEAAFVINALSFLVSAFSIWLIPAGEMREGETPAVEKVAIGSQGRGVLARVWVDIREGWTYIWRTPLVAALIGVNMLWAMGGGAIYLVYDQLGAQVFAPREGWQPDAAAAAFYFASGIGLFISMMLARRAGDFFAARRWTALLIGCGLIAHGIVFALAGLMPTLLLAALVVFVSRLIVGVEFAVQDTLLMSVLPDRVRGRVMITDRAGEMVVMGVGSALFGWSLNWITPHQLTIISGLLAASPGVVWLLLVWSGKLSLPPEAGNGSPDALAPLEEEPRLASVG